MSANQKLAIYSISDIYPLFEYMHSQIGIFSNRFTEQNEIARTIWLAMRIDGEIKNGGIEQLFLNLGEGFNTAYLLEVLQNIKSERGLEIVQKFLDYIHKSDKHTTSFYGDYAYVSGFDKTLKKLHNELSDEYYTLDPSVEALIVQYAEANWSNPDFQEAIKDVVFETAEKDESELIGNLNDAIQSGNVSSAKKILKNLKTVNQSCQYGFVPLLRLSQVSNNAKKIAVCQLLMDHGADLTFTDQYHNTVLHEAAGDDNNIEFIEFLLDHGMDIDIKDDYNNTPIFRTDTSPENCRLLISRGANVNAKSTIGFSPLTKMLGSYSGWYGNKHANEYQPKIKNVIDQLFAVGATFNSEILIRNQTELCMFVEDPVMLEYLLKQKSIKDAPEFNPNYKNWSAVFEASLKGNLECLNLLAEHGAFLNQELDVPHYETKTFSGATPMNVAKNDEIRTYLETQNGSLGNRKHYSLFLETRGNDEASVLELMQQIKGIDAAEGVQHYHQLKKKPDEDHEYVDGKFILYKPLFLTSKESEEDSKTIESQFRQFGCELTLI